MRLKAARPERYGKMPSGDLRAEALVQNKALNSSGEALLHWKPDFPRIL